MIPVMMIVSAVFLFGFMMAIRNTANCHVHTFTGLATFLSLALLSYLLIF